MVALGKTVEEVNLNRASPATGWVRNPVMKSPKLDPTQASSYDFGWTTNPITGCLNSCPYCFARKLANTRLKESYLANKTVAPLQTNWFHTFSDGYIDSRYDAPFYPRYWEDRLQQMLKAPKNSGIFVCDMSDLFGIGIPEEWTQSVLDVIRQRLDCRFYLLTKQPAHLSKFSPFPDNCWVGVSVCNDKMLDVAVDKLEDIPAKHKFISFEPLLKRLTLSLDYALYYSGVGQVIIGAQTQPNVYPRIEWVQEIVQVADKAGIRVYLKDNLKPLFKPFMNFRKTAWWGNMAGLRQEMPYAD